MRAGFLMLGFVLSGCEEPHDHSSHGVDTEQDAVSYERAQSTDGGSYWVSYEPSIDPMPLLDLFDITVDVYDGIDQVTLLPGVVIAVDATMPGHGHGMDVTPDLIDNGDGTFLFTGMSLSMPGEWLLEVVVDGEQGQETASFGIWCCE